MHPKSPFTFKAVYQFLIGLCLFVFASSVLAYTFPGNLPPGCSGSGGNYTCNINTEMDYDVTFSDTGNVTVNHYGRYDLAAGRSAGTATQTANVTINVVSPTYGDTYIDLASGTNVYANFNATTYSSANSVRATMDGTATIHGNFVADSQKHVYLDMNDDSVLNGDVDASAYIYIFVELFGNATINGDVSAITDDSYSFHSGNVRLKSAGARVNGNVSAAIGGQISNRGTITGCALLADNDSGSEIELISGSSTGSICQGTLGACAASSTYLRNFTSTTPPDCEGLPAELIAEYHLDEESWDGGGNPVKDTAAYTGGPFDGQVYSGAPVPTNSNPARAVGVGNDGTCGYAYFSPQVSSTFRMVGLPIDTATLAKTSVSFWVYWNGIGTSIPIAWGANALFFTGGRLGFGTNTYALHGISSAGLENRWVHVTAVFTNGASSDNALYIDGVKQTLSVTQNSPPSTNWMSPDLTVSGYFYNYNVHHLYDSYVDEVKVYRGAMTQAQVTADYNAAHSCGTQLLAEYRFDEASWNGTANEVIDSSGSGYHGNAINSATTAFSDRAIAGTNGTCAYGVFDGAGKAVLLPTTFPRLKDSVSMTFWVKRLGNPEETYSRLFVDDTDGSYGYGVKLNNDGSLNYFKRGSGSSHRQSGNGVILTVGEWYFVAITVDDAADSLTFYTYDQSGTLLNTVTHSGYTDTYTSYAPTGQGASIGALRNGNYPFNGEVDELRVYSGALTQTEVNAIRQETHPCASYVSNTPASNFNCVSLEEPNTSAGHLYMQRRNNNFSIRVVALKSDGTPEADFSALSDKNVLLAFIDQANGNAAIEFRENNVNMTSKTLTFSSGNNTGYVQVDNLRITPAYRNLKCQITDSNQSPALVVQSGDNFSVRPSDVTNMRSYNANADTVNGSSTTNTPTRVAGANFAIGASGGTYNYDGTFKIDHTKLVPHTGAVQVGTLTGTFSAANPTAWGWSQNNFQYSEVGYFKIAPYGIYDDDFTQVDISNSDCTDDFSNTAVDGKFGCKFGNLADSEYFGRFIPHHFEISNVSSTAACSAFNYYGQDGVTTNFTLTAHNAKSTHEEPKITENYTGAFAKLPLNTWSSFNFAATGLPSGASLTSGTPAPSGSWENGVADIIATHKIDRLATPMNPANVSITSRPSDSDSVTMSSATLASNIPFRYGHLSLRNAYGSELLPLTIPVEAQYWDGSTYRTNALDTCTNITTGDAELGNFKKNLNAGETTLLPSGGSMNQGKYNFTLSAPGAGNSGSVDLTLKLDAFPWMGTSNPSARATFGLNKSPIIYMRENF